MQQELKKILISTYKPTKGRGGFTYATTLKEALSQHFQVDSLNLSPENKLPLYFKIPKILTNLWESSSVKSYDIVIRDLDSCLLLNKKPTKTIAIIHHIDYSFASLLVKFVFFFLTPLILRNLREVDAIVVVSKYWQRYFEKRGYRNVHLIYNGFEPSFYNLDLDEIEQFKKNYGLLGKPIVYLGDCQKAKGVTKSYEALKGIDVYLVTSGKQGVKIPAKNLELGYEDYLKLLSASFLVVTMSQFPEGWCRTTHEAMLLKKPVVGSGRGGMRELLEGGHQIICDDFNSLKEKVKYLLDHPQEQKRVGEAGFNFAKNFTAEKFKNDWLKLLFRVCGNKIE
ncbi:MAG: group 1 glycosyl transferase [Parcubacteria group bacterium Gr01-1014_30]|nr:MAG: group 1 glycosyl transferase [Parcubacteria group bacterium Gr01-1014_30]